MAFARCSLCLSRTALEGALTRWAEAVLGPTTPRRMRCHSREACALDGKTARGSFDGLNKAVHLLSLPRPRVGADSRPDRAVPQGGGDKTNEHKTALRLLEGFGAGRSSGSPATRCSVSARWSWQVHSTLKGHLIVVRQGESTDASGQHPSVCPFRGRGFFPLGSSRSGVMRWTRRRPSTKDTAASGTSDVRPPRR